MISITSFKNKFGLFNVSNYFKNKLKFGRDNPFYFYPDGLCVFVGAQGTGKTLSAVLYVNNLMKRYENAKLCTNIFLRDYPIVTLQDWLSMGNNEEDYYKHNQVFPFNNADDLKKIKNGEKGVIFLIDEIQLYFNSLESKNINMEVMTFISQQRKQRIHIIATSQVFGRMAKPLREQFSNVVKCACFFGFIQYNKLIDKDDIEDDNSSDSKIKAKVKSKNIFLHSYDYYNMYDTYYVIDKNKFIDRANGGYIYDN